MKQITLVALFILVSNVVFAQGTGVERILSRYLDIKDALITGNTQEVQQAGALFKATLFIHDDLSGDELRIYTEHLQKMLVSANQLTLTSNLETQRKAFEDLSPVIWELIETAAIDGHNYYYLYCAMRNAYWVSDNATIENPYYSKSMQTCGSVTESKKAL
jgi:hypothetical protein